ncbi:MAG: hypothetical protein K2M55_02165 [Muribaculaceae bacterium]|nr:hypothetical protein [Muribaculaceae bacterium]
MKKVIYAIAAMGLLGLAACSDSPKATDSEFSKPIELSSRAKEASQCASKLDVKIFQIYCDSIKSTNANGNSIIAPLSLTTYLGMFSNLIDDEDFNAAICDYFGTSDKATVNEVVSEYMNQLSTLDSRTKVNFSNKIWYDQKYNLSGSIVDVVKTYYDATLEGADFTNEDAVKSDIRDWVNTKSEGMISNWEVEHIDKFMAAQVMMFHGPWATEFDPANTSERVFHTPLGMADVLVPTMQGKLAGRYILTETYQAVRFDFGAGIYVADVVLPREGVNIDDVISEPNFGMWTDEDMYVISLNVSMPKFTVYQYCDGIQSLLEKIDPRFNIYNKHIALFEDDDVNNITSIMQHVAMEVNESGAKVVSVTHNGWATAYNPSEFHINRPFVMMIRLRDTGAILAAARIVNPLEAN